VTSVLPRRLAALAAVGAATRAGAQNFPSKPIRWIIPFAAAGNYDVTSRPVGEAMGRRLGQTVIPDNRPGAGGIVGLEAAANAPADGYTVVMGSFSVLWVAPYLAGKPSMVPLFALPQIKAGKLKALLVLSPERISQLPDVPSLSDIGTQPFAAARRPACSPASKRRRRCSRP
jgi:tripartite-type tricarboxylate transporter receptor subunit TctC